MQVLGDGSEEKTELKLVHSAGDPDPVRRVTIRSVFIYVTVLNGRLLPRPPEPRDSGMALQGPTAPHFLVLRLLNYALTSPAT